jgi:hypothetical protein
MDILSILMRKFFAIIGALIAGGLGIALVSSIVQEVAAVPMISQN